MDKPPSEAAAVFVFFLHRPGPPLTDSRDLRGSLLRVTKR